MPVYTPTGPSRFLISSAPGGDPAVFPLLPGQQFYAEKSMNWDGVSVQKSASGRRRTVNMWSSPVWKFNVSYDAIRSKATLPELQQLYAFFGSACGQYATWKFYDPYDNTVTGQPFGTGDGVTVQFQLIRSFIYEGYTWTEPVYALYGNPSIYIDGILSDPSTYTLDDYGQITFASAISSGAIVSWSGQFCFLCAFTDNGLKPAQLVQNIWTMSGLAFESIKP